MAGSVDQIERVLLSFILIVHLDGVTLNGNTTFPLQIHIVQQLVLHVTIGHSSGKLQQPVSQCALTVIDVCNDAEVPYSLHSLKKKCKNRKIWCICFPGITINFARMLLADKKKEENISEYIIHMYQTELLLRNFELDIEKVKLHVIGNIPEGKTDKNALAIWYDEVIAQMINEGLEKEGHLNSVQDEVQALSDLSLKLLAENEEYRQVFNAARPAIRSSITASDGLLTNPVQACLNGVFGLLLARMNGKEVAEDQLQDIEQFGNVLSYLSYYYKQG